MKFRKKQYINATNDYFAKAATGQPPLSTSESFYGLPGRTYSVIAQKQLSDDSNWTPVVGHVMHVKVSGIYLETLTSPLRELGFVSIPDVTTGVVNSQSESGPENGNSLTTTFRFYVLFTDSTGTMVVKTDPNGIPLPQLDTSGQPIANTYTYVPLAGLNIGTYHFPVYVPVTTDATGTAMVYLKSGPLIHMVNRIELSAEDENQYADIN